jgi:Glycosyl hydrolases family 43
VSQLLVRSFFAILLSAFMLRTSALAAESAPTFRPGEIWRDTAGKPINAHGGGLLFHAGRYYWYGEHKEGVTTMPEVNRSWGGTRNDVVGIHCYSSSDLYAWQDEGLALRAVPNDPTHDLHPSKVLERPKVVYNPTTKKFVMWMHVDSVDYALSHAGVAVADAPTGPFTYIRSERPLGQMSRDQTLFQDDDGTAYRLFSSENNATLWIVRLSDDYLSHTQEHARAFVDRHMEAASIVRRENRYWLIASDCTGWAPNPARSAVADHILGPWTELGNPCIGPGAETTFGGQSAYILPVVGIPGACIFVADRWNQHDLPDSRIVWLPLVWEEGRPRLRWYDQWDLGVFTKP